MQEVRTPSLLETYSAEAFANELGLRLLSHGRIDEKSLERAARAASEGNTRLEQALTQLGLISDRVLADTMAEVLQLNIVGPADFPQAPILPERFKPKFLKRARALPIAATDDTLSIAAVDPLDRSMISAFALASRLAVEVSIGLPIDLESAYERLYGRAEGGQQGVEIAAREDGLPDEDAERLKDLASEEPLIRLVNQIISRAVETRASDIHLEPTEDRLRVRYRYDGVLHDVDAPPRHLQPAVVSRIKIMAMLDIAERRLPQDGRIKLAVRGHEIDLRVSTIPSFHGERVVLRILDRSAIDLNFDKLGMPGELRSKFERMLELPNGIILVTGPTGSGKTTTLYTGLLHLNSAGRNIMTVEDPIEYHLPGTTQIQVKPQIGLNFASLLRSILRQDPDVIMIGEIRDIETAQIAVQAALTGHTVLSTLHTNSAASTIARLRDMGLEDYLLTATLNGIMGQRLIRRLCSSCKRPTAATAEMIEHFELQNFVNSGEMIIFEPEGCPRCRGTGYLGRIAVSEILEPSDAVSSLILSRADSAAIHDAACAEGMRTMYEAGMMQVAAGMTSLSEVLRSLRLDG